MTPADAADAHRYRAFLLSPTRFGEHGPPDRRVSASNARAMAAFLGDRLWGVCTFDDIVTMADEPAGEVRRRLRDWFASATANDVSVFAYSGRGVGDHDDTRIATATPGEAISGRELAEWMQLGDAHAVYVLVDADGTRPEHLVAQAPPNVAVMAASDALVAIDHGAGTASSFTSTLTAALTAIREPDDTAISRSLAQAPGLPRSGDPDASTVHVPHERFLVEVPLRRVTPRVAATASGDGMIGWAVVAALAVVAVVAFFVFAAGSSDGDDAAIGQDTMVDISALPTLAVDAAPPTAAAPPPEPTLAVPESPTVPAPTTSEPSLSGTTEPATATSSSTSSSTSSVPSTTETPGDVLASADLRVPGNPIGDPPCDGSWVAQVGATDAPASVAAEALRPALEPAGTSYTFTPGSCSSFNQGSAFYVVYLGPFDTANAARSACDSYVAVDSSARQCFALQLN